MLKVFLAEDETVSRKAIKKMIQEMEDTEVIGEAENGVSAIEQLEKLVPDVVILDINMPEMDGLTLAEWIRGHYPQVFLLFLTGYSSFAYAHKAIKLEALDYILKPTRQEELRSALNRARILVFGESLANRERLFSCADGRIVVNQRVAELYGYRLPKELTCRSVVLRAIEHINDNYSCDLTLKHMGDFLFISQSYFSEIMKQETGVTFSEYLTITRIEAAKALLLNDRNMKIYAVARKVGYVDSKYFSQIFRRYTGVTPNQFRGD